MPYFVTEGPAGTNLYLTHDVPQFALGQRAEGSESTAWLYVQANGAITAAGYVVVVDETFQAAQLSTSNDAEGDLVAVAPLAFADNAYGWVQVKGPCVARVAASCAANVTLNTTSTAGQLDDDGAVAAMRIDGLVLTAAREASAGTAAAMLNDPVIVGIHPGYLDDVVAGTAAANKALVLGASGEIATITTQTVGTLNVSTAAVNSGTLISGSNTTDRVTIKGIYMSPANVVVAVPTIANDAAENIDEVAVDVAAAFSMAPAVGDAVIAIPQEALPTDCVFLGAWVSATDTITVSFGSKEGGGGVTGANKNFKFLVLDLT